MIEKQKYDIIYTQEGLKKHCVSTIEILKGK